MEATTATVAWLVATMMSWNPPGRSFITEAKETADEGKARYEQIADALVKVVYDPAVPTIFRGDHGRARTAMLVLSVAYFESGFRKDVDLGLGKIGRGDFGRSHCMMQLNLGRDRTSTTMLEKMVGKSWSADDVVSDRTKCFFAGHRVILKSFQSCKNNPVETKLAIYASGKCEEGWGESALRVNRAVRWYTSHKPPYPDATVVAELTKSPSLGDGRVGVRAHEQ